MKPPFHPKLDEVELASALYALGDPVRLEIVRNLARAGLLNCNASCATLELPKSTLSYHFRILREAGLVRSRKDGVQMVNALRREEVDARFPGLLAAVLGESRPTRKPARARPRSQPQPKANTRRAAS